MTSMELKESLVVLTEGAADQNFLRKLSKKRGGFPNYDAPYPTHEIAGKSNFGRMLSGLRGDARGFKRLKGILIALDSQDVPSKSFGDLQKQIEEAGGYPVPAKPESVAARTADHPAVGVMMLPDPNKPGALETLCVEEILGRKNWAKACVDSFLSCDKIDISKWTIENQHKAHFHCLVAALNSDDPGRAVSWAFKDPKPVIDVMAKCFDPIAARFQKLCLELIK